MAKKRKPRQEGAQTGKDISQETILKPSERRGQNCGNQTTSSFGNSERSDGDDELYGLALLLYNTEHSSSYPGVRNAEEERQNDNDDEMRKKTREEGELKGEKEGEVSDSKCCPSLNRHLIIYKSFYFFFSLAVGALLPYLPVFYKQLWMSARQTGILIGIRPLIQLVGTPLWGLIADTYKQSKIIFIISLIACLVSNYSISVVSPVFHLGPCKDNATIGIVQEILSKVENGSTHHRNSTHHGAKTLEKGKTNNSRSIWVRKFEDEEKENSSLEQEKVNHLIRKMPTRLKSFNPSNNSLEKLKAENSLSKMTDIRHFALRNAILQQAVRRNYRKTDVELLHLITNASTSANGEEVYNEVIKERDEKDFDFLNMVGEYPWPLDTVANYESTQTTSDWQTHHDTQLFTLLLVITVIGSLIAAPAITLADTATLQNLGEKTEDYGRQRVWGTFGWGLGAFVVGSSLSTVAELNDCNNPLSINYLPSFYAFACLMGIAILLGALFKFDENHSHEVNVCQGLRTLLDYRYTYFLFTVLFCGSALGFIETFLFWHLQDIGGSQFLFSTIALIQCASEVVAYCFSGVLIKLLGHHQALYLGLSCYTIRFFGYAFITHSWVVLPFEVLHGISSAAVWSAAVVFVGLIPGAHATMQGILAGVHWGLGNGGGGLLGGLLISYFGASNSFLIFGVSSTLVLCLFVILNSAKYFQCLQWSKGNSTRTDHPFGETKNDDTVDEVEYDDLY